MTAISPVSVVEPEFDTAFPFDDQQYECVREAERHVVFCRNLKQQRRKLKRQASTGSNGSNGSVGSCGSGGNNANPREEFEIALTPTSSRLREKLSTRISQMRRITVLKRSMQKSERRQSKERRRPASNAAKDEQDALLPKETLQPDYPLTRIEKTETYEETLTVKSSGSREVPLSRVRSVSFAEKLVTEVRMTPFVLPQDKPRFFYSPSEIRMFKIDFRYRLQNGFAAYDDIYDEYDGGNCFCVPCPC